MDVVAVKGVLECVDSLCIHDCCRKTIPTIDQSMMRHVSSTRVTIQLAKEQSRLDIRKFYFSQRVVNGWNGFPATVVNAETVNAFKNAFDRNYVKDMDSRSR